MVSKRHTNGGYIQPRILRGKLATYRKKMSIKDEKIRNIVKKNGSKEEKSARKLEFQKKNG